MPKPQVIDDLYNAGLINISVDKMNTTMTWDLGLLDDKLTPFGKSLLDFVILE